jgi:hypothetical protein
MILYYSLITETDAKALELYNSDVASAIEYVTNFSEELGNNLVKEWFTFFGELFIKYKDGYIMNKDPNNKQCACSAGSAYYPQSYYDFIAAETGDHYMIPTTLSEKEKFKAISKETLLAMR